MLADAHISSLGYLWGNIIYTIFASYRLRCVVLQPNTFGHAPQNFDYTAVRKYGVNEMTQISGNALDTMTQEHSIYDKLILNDHTASGSETLLFSGKNVRSLILVIFTLS